MGRPAQCARAFEAPSVTKPSGISNDIVVRRIRATEASFMMFSPRNNCSPPATAANITAATTTAKTTTATTMSITSPTVTTPRMPP